MCIYRELRQFGLQVDVYDPHANKAEVLKEFNIDLIDSLYGKKYDSIILAMCHSLFLSVDTNNLESGDKAVIYDTKGALDRSIVDARL